jgi:HK97 family phage prohead protease
MNTTLTGYGIKFNSLSEDLGGFREIIAPQAIERTVRESIDLRALVSHDNEKVLGRMTAGTLKIAADRIGLKASITMPDTQFARDALVSIDRGDAPGWSFGFVPLTDEWKVLADDTVIRTITDMRVREISAAVAFPAYGATERAGAPGRGAEPWEYAISDRTAARQMATAVLEKVRARPHRDIRLRADYETFTREVIYDEPRNYEADARELFWLEADAAEEQHQREQAILLAKAPRLRVQVEGLLRVRAVISAAATAPRRPSLNELRQKLAALR